MSIVSDAGGDESSEHNTPSELHKRPRSSPTYLTPHRSEKRVPLWELVAKNGSDAAAAPRLLSEAFQCLDETSQGTKVVRPCKDEKWRDSEIKALVEFVVSLHWPSHKSMEFWSSASDFVHARS